LDLSMDHVTGMTANDVKWLQEAGVAKEREGAKGNRSSRRVDPRTYAGEMHLRPYGLPAFGALPSLLQTDYTH